MKQSLHGNAVCAIGQAKMRERTVFLEARERELNEREVELNNRAKDLQHELDALTKATEVARAEAAEAQRSKDDASVEADSVAERIVAEARSSKHAVPPRCLCFTRDETSGD